MPQLYTTRYKRREHTVAIITRKTGTPGTVRVQDATGPVRLVFEVPAAKLSPARQAS